MDDPSLDQLVDEITRRVRARLATGAQATGAQATGAQATGAQATGAQATGPAGRSCAPDGTGDCGSCGGCAVNRPDDVRHIVERGAARIGSAAGHGAPAADLAPLIDHTLLKADASRDELRRLCEEARQYGFATVCVNPVNVRFCAAQLEGVVTEPIAVVGFPLGAATATAKAFEAREAVRHGAAEIDMVINVGALKSRDYTTVLEDIMAVVAAASPRPVKVIIETGLLDQDQKVVACALSKVAGAAYVKTSTGFGAGGATAEDIALMRGVVGPEMGVKASGGMRTEADARRMIEAGATRIGASASVAIVTGEGEEARRLRVVGGY